MLLFLLSVLVLVRRFILRILSILGIWRTTLFVLRPSASFFLALPFPLLLRTLISLLSLTVVIVLWRLLLRRLILACR
jgi:hypothetical protein